MKNILKDLYDIINEMNNPNRGDSTDFELIQKINDISNRMTQVNIGQESVKEVMTELKSTLERIPGNNKRPQIVINHTMKTKSNSPGYPVI